MVVNQFLLPKLESNLLAESIAFSLFSHLLPRLQLLLHVPDLRLQPEALKLPAGRAELPVGGSGIAALSASAPSSKVAAPCCSWKGMREKRLCLADESIKRKHLSGAGDPNLQYQQPVFQIKLYSEKYDEWNLEVQHE